MTDLPPSPDIDGIVERLRYVSLDAHRQVPSEVVSVCWSAASALQSAQARIRELTEALESIRDESAFNQQRFEEDTDADYFLRCFKAVKALAAQAISQGSQGNE